MYKRLKLMRTHITYAMKFQFFLFKFQKALPFYTAGLSTNICVPLQIRAELTFL